MEVGVKSDRIECAHNPFEWFGWIFPNGKTAILPTYPAGKSNGLVTMEARFGVHPAMEEEKNR